MSATRILSSVLALTLVAPASAQIRRGFLSSHANHLSLESSPQSTAGSELYYNSPGDNPVVPGNTMLHPVGYTGPTYRLQDMFPIHYLDVDIDAISSGNDLLRFDALGQLDLTDRWGAMVISVGRDANGLPGGWVDQRRQQDGPGSTGADLISYFFEDPTGGANPPAGVPPALFGEAFLEQSAENLGLTTADEIDALDWFIPLLSQQQGVGGAPGLFFNNQNEIYFSLTAESAGVLKTTSFFPGGMVASGGAIYRIVWDTLDAEWDPVELVYGPGALDFNPTATNPEGERDIDALAVNVGQGSFVFSTKKDDTLVTIPQLQVLTPITGGVVEFKRNSNGDSLPPGIRIEDEDEIDAICGLDPEPDLFSTYISTPYLVDHPSFMGFSLTRTELSPGSGSPFLATVQVTGWAGQSPAYSEVDIYTSLNLGLTWDHVGNYTRKADQHTWEIVVPLAPPQSTNVSGIPFLFGATTSVGSGPVVATTGFHAIRL